MKKELMIAGCCILLSTLGAVAQMTLQHLLTENLVNPIGIDVTTPPRFSWQLESSQRNVQQSAWEIKVTEGKNLVWNSGKVVANQSVQVPYGGKTLQPATRYTWQVRAWDNNGRVTPWSSPAFFQTALQNANAWKAQWITPGFTEDAENRPAVLFRKAFGVSKRIKSATAYITSHGMYEAQINGQRVGDAYLTPGWTSYKKRLQYQVYDVTSLLANGQNAVGVSVGNGWYRGYLAWSNNKNSFGSDIALLFQLAITYTDGTTELVVTDESWKSSTGSIRYTEIYHGEIIDTRQEKTGWTKAGYNDAAWSGVQTGNYSKEVLIATYNEPVRKHETFKPVKVLTTPGGQTVLDFGQNLVGWVMVKAKGQAGDSVIIRHAEVMDKYGYFYTENLRTAKATATYILNGKEEQVLEPHFTFFGFRYIQVEDYPGEIKPENFTAVALYSDMAPTGNFECSNTLLNQLQHNIQWGQRGNFLDVPTDCPQRDERLGWTGDAQAFSRTATFNFGVNNFFAKWLHDVAADQRADGVVPFVVPNVLGPDAGASTGWADVITILPWNLYLAYGDKRILEEQYKSMKAWVGFMQNKSRNDLWQTGFHFGDWLFYRPFDDNDGKAAVTDKYLIAQCFYANSVQLLINAAKVLGNTEDVSTYTTLLEKIKSAFAKEYLTPNGRLVSGTQTAYVLALQFDMLPESLRPQAAERLVQNIKNYDNHLTTGFLGTPYLCHVLSRFGHTDIAYKLLLQESYPSWLYPVKMGATTIWERWDGQKPDSTFQTPGMNSFNHYAYGAIGDWMYRVIAGLDTYEDGPGYKHIKIQPHIGGGLTKAAATLKTYYGTASSSWTINENELILEVEIPANSNADIYIPAVNAGDIRENGKAISEQRELQVTRKDQYVVVKTGSGKYRFVTAAPGETKK
ncbi:alpha-L-rhamnosidase [Niastella caeni]|uniref:alpha-L-rhamnosidase n=1 Tax=Niastella caeni TaxID=2569763 RepID=A0A4S8HS67_9BACT|nr:alpha-L-rhamnosidase [Niastella caeni]THU38378.1 alpha-L-rhamnosidase [Niastella caeni]